MASHDENIPSKKKGKKRPKSVRVNNTRQTNQRMGALMEFNSYIPGKGEASNDVEKAIYIIRSYIYSIIKHECNVLSNLLNPTKRTKSKNSRYSLILKGFYQTMSTLIHQRTENNP